MIITDDDALAERLRLLRSHGGVRGRRPFTFSRPPASTTGSATSSPRSAWPRCASSPAFVAAPARAGRGADRRACRELRGRAAAGRSRRGAATSSSRMSCSSTRASTATGSSPRSARGHRDDDRHLRPPRSAVLRADPRPASRRPAELAPGLHGQPGPAAARRHARRRCLARGRCADARDRRLASLGRLRRLGASEEQRAHRRDDRGQPQHEPGDEHRHVALEDHLGDAVHAGDHQHRRGPGQDHEAQPVGPPRLAHEADRAARRPSVRKTAVPSTPLSPSRWSQKLWTVR